MYKSFQLGWTLATDVTHTGTPAPTAPLNLSQNTADSQKALTVLWIIDGATSVKRSQDISGVIIVPPPIGTQRGCTYERKVWSTLAFINTHTHRFGFRGGKGEPSLIRKLSSTIPNADQWGLRGAPVTACCACVPLMAVCVAWQGRTRWQMTKTDFTNSQLWPCWLVSDFEESISYQPCLNVGIWDPYGRRRQWAAAGISSFWHFLTLVSQNSD